MIKIVKHIFGLFLLLCFMLSATGVHFHKHICSACHTSNYAIIIEPKCACDTEHEHCQTAVHDKDCHHSCHTDHKYLKIKDEYIYSNYSIFKADWSSAMLTPINQIAENALYPHKNISIVHYAPPPRGSDIFPLISQYRL